jgi:prepilin peptidase CpaA
LNLITSAPVWLLAVLIAALLAGAIEDAVRLRISNITSLVVLAAGICAAVLAGPSLSLWQNGLVFCVILALGTAAFAAGALGGGDVKFLAALGIWVDLIGGVWLVAMVFIAGGFLGAAYIASRPYRRNKKQRIPYGIAIAIGAFAVMAMSRGWLQHHPRPLPPIPTLRHSA